MPYRNKTYVAFDADSDIRYYRLMKAWKQSDNSEFNFFDAHDLTNIWQYSSEETIKRNLRERLMNTKIFVLLVGEKTKYLYKYVKWEIEQALSLDLPIIVVNLNGNRGLDDVNCPSILKDKLALHISFNAKIIQKSLENWRPFMKIIHLKKSRPFQYDETIYKHLGL